MEFLTRRVNSLRLRGRLFRSKERNRSRNSRNSRRRQWLKLGRRVNGSWRGQKREKILGEVGEHICSELNCSLNQYYAVLNILKETTFMRKGW